MAVEIPTRTAIIVMIVISIVYSTLTFVLCVCTCCCICKQKLKKIGASVAITRPPALDEMECEVSTSQSWTSHTSFTDKESSEVSSATASSMELHNRRRHNNTPEVDIDRTVMLPLRQEHTNTGPSPQQHQLQRHPVLPPIGQTASAPHVVINNSYQEPKLPSIPQTKRINTEEKPMETPSALPSTSEGFVVLTVHKSTLKRKKKAAEDELKIDNCEDEKRSGIHDKPKSPVGGESAQYKKQKVARTESTKPLVEEEEDEINDEVEQISGSSFRPLSPLREVTGHKKTRIGRTESTKPLMEDEDDTFDDSITGGAILWSRSQPQISDSGLVLENMDADDEDTTSTKSLDALQEDLMEMITRL